MANVVSSIIQISTQNPQQSLDEALSTLGIPADNFRGAVTIRLQEANQTAKIVIFYEEIAP